ncbi:copper-binding protein [Thiomonas sp.]
MNKPLKTCSTLALAVALCAPALAAPSHADHDHATPEGMAQHMQMMQGMAASAPAASGAQHAHQTEGLVRKIDAASGKITLRHGATAGMGAMTMIYRAQDKAQLDGLKEGDTVVFSAEKIDGAYILTSISRKP